MEEKFGVLFVRIVRERVERVGGFCLLEM